MTATRFSGMEMLDETGQKVGTVKDVIYDDPTQIEPTWLVVKPGMLRGQHYVPAAGAYRTTDERLISPYPAEQVHTAPKAGSEHVISPELRQRLAEHYDLDAGRTN